MKSNKILKILLPVVFLLIIFAVIGKKQGWFGKALTVKVAVENAENRTIVETITANGKIQPEKEVKISPDVSGEIVELTIKEGDQVEKGQLLLRIKPDTYILRPSVLQGHALHNRKPSLPRLNFHLKEINSYLRNRLFQNLNMSRRKHRILLLRQR
jgi:HlyD family secretion protein